MSTPAPYSPPPQPGGVYQQQVNGTLILVLGIIGIFCTILGPVALIMGKSALKTIDSGMGDPSQRSNAQAGMICGIVGTVLLCLGIVWGIIWFAIFGAAWKTAMSGMPTSPSAYTSTTGGMPAGMPGGATTSGNPMMPTGGQGGNGMPPGNIPMPGAPNNGNQGGNGAPTGPPSPSGNMPGNASGAP